MIGAEAVRLLVELQLHRTMLDRGYGPWTLMAVLGLRVSGDVQ